MPVLLLQFYSFGAESIRWTLLDFVPIFDCHYLNILSTKNLDVPHIMAHNFLNKL